MTNYRYIDQTLLPDEKVEYWTRPHWIIFFSSTIYIFLAIIFLIFGPEFLPGRALFNLQIYQLLALVALLIAIYTGVTSYITYMTSEYGVTNKRVIIKVGWIRRQTLELFLDKIEAVSVDQSIPGRIFDYGTITVVGTGGSHDPYRYVPSPLYFRKQVQKQVDLEEQARR